jgi:hypothetical protein
LIDELKYKYYGLVGVKPDRDKIARMAIASAKFEAGNVYLPEAALWLADLEAELFAIPGSRFDDQCYSISQALNDGFGRPKCRRRAAAAAAAAKVFGRIVLQLLPFSDQGADCRSGLPRPNRKTRTNATTVRLLYADERSDRGKSGECRPLDAPDMPQSIYWPYALT